MTTGTGTQTGAGAGTERPDGTTGADGTTGTSSTSGTSGERKVSGNSGRGGRGGLAGLSGMSGLSGMKLPDRAARGRMLALARAELTLLRRNRTALFGALLMPLMMILFMVGMAENLGMDSSELSIAAIVGTGSIGMVLVIAVYSTLIPSYVARREERVLKRLRTGEVTDHEILAGTALPAIAVGVIQIVAIVGIGAIHPSLSLPSRPDLLLAGVLIGLVLMVLMAIVTAGLTRTVESSQLTAMPVLMVAMFTSGMMVPLDIMPDTLADICRLLPMTPAVELIRAGWLGPGVTDVNVLKALAVSLVWLMISVHAARRYFRWDSRQ